MSKYNFFIAGRWRNKDEVKKVLEAVRSCGKTAYCFIENDYKGEKIEFKPGENPDTFMKKSENLPIDDSLIQKIFKKDISALKQSDNFLLVFPSGKASHIEAGIAYGMGKKCYAIGLPEKTETLYCIFEEIFLELESLKTWLSQ